MYPRIILKPGKEESLRRYHPWVFSGAIGKVENTPEGHIHEGDKAAIYTSDRKFIGIGHTQVGSIAVRMLSFDPRWEHQPIGLSFYQERIQQAYLLRKNIGIIHDQNNCFRLVHGEGDFLPGLVVDVYGNTAVVQAHSVGIHMDKDLICQAIAQECKDRIHNIYYKSENTLPFNAQIEVKDGYWLEKEKETDPIAIENGIRFHPNWIEGQKTGFFIDQRENRALVEKYSKDRKVLNMFCYTGGFSLYALRGGAREVVSVDSSTKAIELTEKNVSLNFGNQAPHSAYAEDAFDYLGRNNKVFDLIILDPPAFAKHHKVLRQALQGYRRLNALGFQQIAPGGILFTFSCSQAVSREDFRLAVFSAAAQSGRNVRILHQLSQPADHPINIYHPEGEYLKGLVLQVE